MGLGGVSDRVCFVMGWEEGGKGGGREVKERVAGLAVHTRNEPAFWVFWSEGDVRNSLWGLVG